MRHPIDPIRAAVLHHLGRRAVVLACLAAVLPPPGRSAIATAQAAPPAAQSVGAPNVAPAAPAPAVPPAAVDKGGESFDFNKELGQGEGPMSADQAAALAVQTGPTIAKAQATAEQARKAASQAVVALYPRLDLAAQYTRLSKPPVIAFPSSSTALLGLAVRAACVSPIATVQEQQECAAAAQGGGQQGIVFPLPLVDQYLLQARVSYPLSDLFFGIMPRYRAAQETVRAQELRITAEAQTVALAAREAFYNYGRARAALLVARSGLAQTDAQLHDVESLVRAGTLARVEQMRAEAQVAAARVAVARAEGSVAIARTALRSLLHRDGEQEIAMAEDFSQSLPPVVEDKEQLVRAAFEHRSELRAFEVMAGVYDKNIRASDADKLPKLAIGGSAEEGNPNQRAAMFQRQWTGTWEAMATLTWSPNDFASGNARASQAEAQRAQTLADMAALEDALRREVGQAYEDYKAARQAMDAAQTGIAAAEESYRVRREQFRAGAAVATDVIIAEGDLNRARLDLVNASIDLRIARARLDRAVERGQAG